jgi:sporulation related protein
MSTFRPGRAVLTAVMLGLTAACSSEQQDWHSAESADTSEAWGRFLEQHPDSELAAQAHLRITQLTEQRDWQHAESVGTVDAYRGFLAQHPSGKWSGEARIRIEGFALGSAPRTAPLTPEEAAHSRAPWGVNALQLARGATPPATEGTDARADTGADTVAEAAAAPAGAPSDLARPGEAAQPAAVAADIGANTGPLTVGGYGVQLGAFATQASADHEWQRLQGRFGAELSGLSPRIVVASSDSGQLFRLQAAAAGEAQARAICDSLKEQAQACVPVLPR